MLAETLNHYETVTRIWQDYHKQLTGSDAVNYDEHGNLYGAIAKTRPNFQCEILEILYEAGFAAGKAAAL